MINANELRIGNWVQLKEDDDILHIKISALAATEIFVDPIPLTPEILEKCGFVNKNDEYKNGYSKTEGYNFYEYFHGYFVISEKAGEYRKYWEVDEDTFYSWHGTGVTSLHQLQNLYFALTGNEIEYKP